MGWGWGWEKWPFCPAQEWFLKNFLLIKHFFSYSLHPLLFCVSVRCTAKWLENHVLYRVAPPQPRPAAPGAHLGPCLLILILSIIFPVL